ncbi:MAG: hypothetical protein VKK42_01935 [Lyngbya sp.]|nr:hypothetical protein [Lyngbya sp.]
MDEIVKKVAGLGLSGILLVIAIGTAGSSAGAMALIASFGGPLGIIGGLGLLGLVGSVGEIVTGYGLETLIKNIYSERSKTESTRYLLKEIKDLPITDDLKLKLKEHLSKKNNQEAEVVEENEVPQEPKTIEIIEE